MSVNPDFFSCLDWTLYNSYGYKSLWKLMTAKVIPPSKLPLFHSTWKDGLYIEKAPCHNVFKTEKKVEAWKVYSYQGERLKIRGTIIDSKKHIDGLVQKRCSSVANALKLHMSCINPSICTSSWVIYKQSLSSCWENKPKVDCFEKRLSNLTSKQPTPTPSHMSWINSIWPNEATWHEQTQDIIG